MSAIDSFLFPLSLDLSSFSPLSRRGERTQEKDKEKEERERFSRETQP
ncbi:hypothetical protein OH491_23235 [Termitidicoccus mucosus]